MSDKITKTDVERMAQGTILWDGGKGAVSGFGARRQRGEGVVYFVKYRTSEGRQRWHRIGRHGSPWTVEGARKEAKQVIGDVSGGDDPAGLRAAARKAATVSELCDLYFADAEAGRLLTRRKIAKKPSTLATDRGRLDRHIKPLLGSMKVGAVTNEDIESFMHAVAAGETAGKIKTQKKRGLANVRGGKGTASRTVGLLGAIFTYAVKKRMRSDNPVRGVMRFADGKRERRLSNAEYAALGAALRSAADAMWPPAVGAAQFLALTGWRRGEALGFRWDEVDLERRTATLADTKTGRSVRPLSKAACDVLSSLPRIGAFVFAASRGSGQMTGFPKFWQRLAKIGHLPASVTPHVLRHSFASLAADLEYSESTIAALIGHKGQTMTGRYIHAADAVLLAAADAVAQHTMNRLGYPSLPAKGLPLDERDLN